jgi:hypothetical protein
MSPDKLVRMANQIATFFSSQPGRTGGARGGASQGFLGPGDALGTEAIREAGHDDDLDDLVRRALPMI